MWYAKQRSDIWYVSFTCVCGGGGFLLLLLFYMMRRAAQY